MPYQAIMQAASTLFATAMTVTVLSFPTPQDLYNTVFPPMDTKAKAIIVSGGIDHTLPTEPANASVPEITKQLDACTDSLSAAVPFGTKDCRMTIMMAGKIASQRSYLPDMKHKLDLVTALYCRVEWVTASEKQRQFDLQGCEGIAYRLAAGHIVE